MLHSLDSEVVISRAHEASVANRIYGLSLSCRHVHYRLGRVASAQCGEMNSPLKSSLLSWVLPCFCPTLFTLAFTALPLLRALANTTHGIMGHMSGRDCWVDGGMGGVVFLRGGGSGVWRHIGASHGAYGISPP